MGYTHYWQVKNKKVPQKKYEEALKDIRKIVLSQIDYLANGNGDEGSSPDFNEEIFLNGVGEQSHETFYLPKNSRDLGDFEFCKTNRKEYDKVVVACLTVLHNAIPELQISSDGDRDELEEGRKLAEEILNKELVNIEDPLPCNAEKFIKKI